jgi:hypothetical protein
VQVFDSVRPASSAPTTTIMSSSASTLATPLLVFAGLLGCCVWVGGFVAIAVVARVARQQLDRPAQVAFFRALGRGYVRLGGPALLVALAAGAALLASRPWDPAALAALLMAGSLLLVTAAGIVQARGMTRLRARALGAPDDGALAARVRRGAVRAGLLRASMGALSLALLAIAAVLAG